MRLLELLPLGNTVEWPNSADNQMDGKGTDNDLPVQNPLSAPTTFRNRRKAADLHDY
jgi:hypothetical protein